MSQDQLAALSRVLYSPTTIVLYATAAFVYLYSLTTMVGRAEERERGRRARRLGAVLAIAALTTHVGHEITRGLAQDRLPLGNMFEVTSLMALVGTAGGLGYLTFGRKRPELNGFVLLGGALLLGLAGLMYSDPGPLMPILDTWWRPFHVSLLVGAMGIFAAAFVFNSLQLLRDTGERAVADARVHGTSGPAGGAPYAGERDTASGSEAGDVLLDPRADSDQQVAERAALRSGIDPLKLAVGTFLGTSLVSWVWLVSASSLREGLTRFLTVNLVMVGAALLARHMVPYLPSTATLDGLAHRTIAFGFVMWTVGTIAGAMWAEVSWGRFWGWDPKETGAFLTWVAYAGYLHARATRGVKGRGAAWIGIGAFVILMGTYLIANYVVVGLHSYAGLG
jgi:ABC-type transport system involved in cytochrome c biogenesis permease subunit